MQDPYIGRFHTHDRFAKKHFSLSLYQYCANSPVANIDVNGDSIWVVVKSKDQDGNTVKHKYYYDNGEVGLGFYDENRNYRVKPAAYTHSSKSCQDVDFHSSFVFWLTCIIFVNELFCR